jgi:hypothetical protein
MELNVEYCNFFNCKIFNFLKFHFKKSLTEKNQLFSSFQLLASLQGEARSEMGAGIDQTLPTPWHY